MAKIIHDEQLHLEPGLFSQGFAAGEFAFVAQDARRSHGALTGESAHDQARQTVKNLGAALKTADMNLADVANLMVYLPDYADAGLVCEVLDAAFGKDGEFRPAATLVGIAGLDGNCRVRMDAIATSARDRRYFRLPELPLARGSRCHGVRAGNFVFLSGVDAADADGRISPPIAIQTQTVLGRINAILGRQDLSLRDLCRTFMFMPSTDYRPGYGEARRAVYAGIFSADEFPPNSGIYIRDLGKDILLRSVAIAYRGEKQIVASPKVRKTPGSFSQAVRVGDWLLIAGQDAVGFQREVLAEGDLAGQTEITLRHVQYIVEEAGGTLDDLVKTTIYLTAGQDRDKFAAAYRNFFEQHATTLPAGLTLEVVELSPGCLVEIDAVAYLRRLR
ncbi:MAG TPA: Rid family hydrolase [Candidatus Binatia bacterium]